MGRDEGMPAFAKSAHPSASEPPTLVPPDTSEKGSGAEGIYEISLEGHGGRLEAET